MSEHVKVIDALAKARELMSCQSIRLGKGMHIMCCSHRCTVTAVSESLQAFDLLFGFLGQLGFLGLLDFCCPLLRGFLRALLVGCLEFGLCTTGLALRRFCWLGPQGVFIIVVT